MTQAQAAEAAGVTLRTWGNWERSAVLSTTVEARARQAVGRHFDTGPADESPLSSVSDAQLLAEIAKRFERRRDEGHGTPSTQAGASPAPEAGGRDPHAELAPEDQALTQSVRESLRPKRRPPERVDDAG
jgi:hypothetical protein